MKDIEERRLELLTTVEVIPYRTFKEKIAITKQLKDCKVEVYKNYILAEKVRYEN